MTDELEQMSPNQRRAVDKALSALETMAVIWASEIRLTGMSERIAAVPSEAERAKRIAAMIEQGFIEGAYRHYLDHKDKCDELEAARATADHSDSAYPDELTPALREVLGWPNFKCARFAHLMVAAGAEINPKAEDEQAAVLHWLIKLVLKHGDKWNEAATADINAMRDKFQALKSQQGAVIESKRSGDGLNERRTE